MAMHSLHGFLLTTRVPVGAEGGPKAVSGVEGCIRGLSALFPEARRLAGTTSAAKATWQSTHSDPFKKDGMQQFGRSSKLLLNFRDGRDFSCWMGVGPGDAMSVVPASDVSPDQSQFLEAAQKGNLVPLFKKLVCSDQLTPILAYECLLNDDDPDAPSFLFDTMEPEPGMSSIHVKRFSSLGVTPAKEIIANENKLIVIDNEDGSRQERVVIDPMGEPGRIAATWKPVMVNGLPDTFCGGWVGYFSNSTKKYEERNQLSLKNTPDNSSSPPEIHLGLYKEVIVFDHASKIIYAIHWVQVDQFETAEDAYNDGKLKLNRLAGNFLGFKDD